MDIDPTDLFLSPTRSFGPRKGGELPREVIELVPAEDADENQLYSYSPTKQYFKRSQILKLMMAWIVKHEHDPKNENTEAALDDEIVPPTFLPHKPGSYWRILRSNKKFAEDCFYPWCKTVNKKQKKPRADNSPLIIEDGLVKVREKRAEHPEQFHFRKQTMTISSIPEAASVVFLMYIFCEEDMILPRISKPKMSSYVKQIVTDACDGRTFEKALEKIPKDILNKIKLKQVRNIALRCNTYVKAKSGSAPTTDPLELMTMTASIPGFQGGITDVYVDGKKLKKGQPPTKKVAEITYLCEDAWRIFLKGCATREKIKDHRKDCKDIETMETLQQQTTECNNAITSLTKSQLIKGVSGVIQIDTTFGLSGLHVTLIVGLLSQFVTETSKKNRPLVLGFLMHTDRKVHHHSNMGRRIDEMISHIDPTKFISAYITDGEPTLKELCSGHAFSHAVHLRCDVHRRKNMLYKIAPLLPTKEDVTLFEQLMFGKKYKSPLGEVVYIGGALSKMDMEKFKKDLTHIKNQFDNDELSQLLDRKADDYFRTNSMMAKLRGGIVSQWVSTNVIESVNHIVQRKIPRKESGHVTALKLVEFVNNSVDEICKAAICDSSEISVAPTARNGATTYLKWYAMTSAGKRDVIEYFGLPTKFMGRDSNLPRWVHENYDKIENYLSKYRVSLIADGNVYVILKIVDPLYSLTLIQRGDYIVCGDLQCPNVYRHTKIAPCRHIITVLSSLHSNVSRKYWQKYEKNFEEMTPQQRLALTQQGGDGTKRIGNPRSKNNDIRAVDFITHSVYNDSAVESHTVDEPDAVKKGSTAPTRAVTSQTTGTNNTRRSSRVVRDSVNDATIRRLGLKPVVDVDSALPIKKESTAPTRAVTSRTTKQTAAAPIYAGISCKKKVAALTSAGVKRTVKKKKTYAGWSEDDMETRHDIESSCDDMGATQDEESSDDDVERRTFKNATGAPTFRAQPSSDDDMEPTHVAERGIIKKETGAATYRDLHNAAPTRNEPTRNEPIRMMAQETAILGPTTPSFNAGDDSYYEPANSNENGPDEGFKFDNGKPFVNIYGNIADAMFPEHIDMDADTSTRFEQLEIARMAYVEVPKERTRSPTPMLVNEQPIYETLSSQEVKPAYGTEEVKTSELPRFEAPLIVNTSYEPHKVKGANLPRLGTPLRMNSTRPCYETREEKPPTLSRRVLQPRAVGNFYSKNKGEEGLKPECKSMADDNGVPLPHKAPRRSLRLVVCGEAVKENEVEEKPSGVMDEALENADTPPKKKRGRPRKTILQK